MFAHTVEEHSVFLCFTGIHFSLDDLKIDFLIDLLELLAEYF